MRCLAILAGRERRFGRDLACTAQMVRIVICKSEIARQCLPDGMHIQSRRRELGLKEDRKSGVGQWSGEQRSGRLDVADSSRIKRCPGGLDLIGRSHRAADGSVGLGGACGYAVPHKRERQAAGNSRRDGLGHLDSSVFSGALSARQR